MPSPASFGKKMARFFGTVVDGHCITNRDRHGTKLWRVEAVAKAGGDSGLGGVADLETAQSTGIETANEET